MEMEKMEMEMDVEKGKARQLCLLQLLVYTCISTSLSSEI